MKQHLVIHHSLTHDSGTVSWQAIRRYHVEKNGWPAIGYHLGVERIGGRYEMLVGRPLLARAAAVLERGLNVTGIHVCFVGNYDAAPPPVGMLNFAAPHLASICDALHIPIDAEHVFGHMVVAPYKTCPGRKFDIAHLVGMMRGLA